MNNEQIGSNKPNVDPKPKPVMPDTKPIKPGTQILTD